MSAEPESPDPRGLYTKFRVTRLDGGSDTGQKHADCEYFVLDRRHDKHAAAALAAYARSCEAERPTLYADLLAAPEVKRLLGDDHPHELVDALANELLLGCGPLDYSPGPGMGVMDAWRTKVSEALHALRQDGWTVTATPPGARPRPTDG